MEAKDVALYGFVSAAQKYVDNHMSGTQKLKTLKTVDIKRLKEELSAQLNSLPMPFEYKKDLVAIGRKAFDEYAREKLIKKHSVVEELGNMFRTTFREDAGYDLDKKVSKSSRPVKNRYDDLDEFGLSANDNVLMAIANAAAQNNRNGLNLGEGSTSIKKPANMDQTYADVIGNEFDKPLSEVINKNNSQKARSSLLADKQIRHIEATNDEETLNEYDDYEEAILSNPGSNMADENISNAIDGLDDLQRKKQEEDDEALELEIGPAVFANIKEEYPYLDREFILSAYSQRQELLEKYDVNRQYIILHRLSFYKLEELREFVEIIMEHDFTVNVDEKKKIVDIMIKFINDENVILSHILSIANQAKVLNGKYEGYRIIDASK